MDVSMDGVCSRRFGFAERKARDLWLLIVARAAAEPQPQGTRYDDVVWRTWGTGGAVHPAAGVWS